MAPAAKTPQSEAPPQTAKSSSTATGAASPRTDIVSAITAMTTTAATSVEAASATAPANSAAAPSGSAALPGAAVTPPTPLRHLNNTTAKLAAWEVAIADAHEEEYSYTYEGQPRTSKVFRCVLVWAHDTSQYCNGEVRKTKGSPPNWLEAAKEKFHNGFKFRISAIELNIKSKPEYTSTTVKHTVDLSKTTMSKLLADTVHRNPQPLVTCAECIAFKSVQAFDITALIDTVSEPRAVGPGNKRVRDIKIIDGTVDTGVQPPEGQPQVHNIICPKIGVF